MNIFLDDERIPADVTWIKLEDVDWVIIRSYEDFVSWLQNRGIPTRLSMDHDLGTDKTGQDCLRYLLDKVEEMQSEIPFITFHTQNIVGKKNMEYLYKNYKRFRSFKFI